MLALLPYWGYWSTSGRLCYHWSLWDSVTRWTQAIFHTEPNKNLCYWISSRILRILQPVRNLTEKYLWKRHSSAFHLHHTLAQNHQHRSLLWGPAEYVFHWQSEDSWWQTKNYCVPTFYHCLLDKIYRNMVFLQWGCHIHMHHRTGTADWSLEILELKI